MKTKRPFVCPLIALCMSLAVSAGATPVFNLDSFDDWDTAKGSDLIGPLPAAEWDYLEAQNPDLYPGSSPYFEPVILPTPSELYVYEGGNPENENDSAGLVMSWGDDSGQDYTAAWEFVYPLDPNLVGSRLLCSAIPPQFAGAGQMNSIGLGLVDATGFARTWTWNCAAVANPATSTISWNQLWDMNIGPIAGPGLAGPAAATSPVPVPPVPAVPPIIGNNPAFNPFNVVSIIAIENGATVANFPAPPGAFTAIMWNWWQNVGVVPEPGTIALLGCASLSILLRRRH